MAISHHGDGQDLVGSKELGKGNGKGEKMERIGKGGLFSAAGREGRGNGSGTFGD